MSIEEAVVERLRVLPTEKQQEVLDFAEFLQQKSVPATLRPSLKGALAHLDIPVDEKDIAEARREMWGNFPREATADASQPCPRHA